MEGDLSQGMEWQDKGESQIQENAAFIVLFSFFFLLPPERLTENLRGGQTSLVAAQMFLFFRVLLLRISPQHLTSLWPIMVTELVRKKFSTYIWKKKNLKINVFLLPRLEMFPEFYINLVILGGKS